MSIIERCPHFRVNTNVWDTTGCFALEVVLISGVSLFQGCPYFRGVLFSGVSLFQECPYFRGVLSSRCPYFRGVLISGVSLFQGVLSCIELLEHKFQLTLR